MSDDRYSRTTWADPLSAVPQQTTAISSRDAIKIGRYSLLEQLGAGNMGEVYAAYDEQLDRRVALKVLSRRLGLPDTARARLIREAKALARISHPNVVSVFEAGVHDGEVFIAMDFVRGQTLEQWLSLPHTWGEILEVFIGLADGLAAMHEHNLIHRDFKPQNVVLDQKGRPQLIDFGLVKQLEDLNEEERREAETSETLRPSGWGDAALTQAGTVTGTLLYMAPEVMRCQSVTPRSDQFSFCTALYEALFNSLPFGTESSEEIVPRVLAGDLVWPDNARGVPVELVEAVMRGLRREPQERWGSMEELRQVLAGLRETFDPDLTDSTALTRRKRLLGTITGGITLVLAIAGTLVANDVIAPSTGTLAVVDATLAVMVYSIVWLLRARWQPHMHSRKLVGLMMLVSTMYAAQSGLGYLAGRTVYDCMLSDIISLAVVTFFAAPLLVNVLRWVSLWLGVCAVMSVVHPEGIMVYFALGNVVGGLMGMFLMPSHPVERWIQTAVREGSRNSSHLRRRKSPTVRARYGAEDYSADEDFVGFEYGFGFSDDDEPEEPTDAQVRPELRTRDSRSPQPLAIAQRGVDARSTRNPAP